jgi:hypothetical protein
MSHETTVSHCAIHILSGHLDPELNFSSITLDVWILIKSIKYRLITKLIA